MGWAWWLAAALALVVAEMLSLDLVLLMFACGALVAVGFALADFPVWVQILAFGAASGLFLLALRPWLLRHLRNRVPLEETNAAANVGRVAVAVTDVTDRTGRVKLAGEVWSARTEGGVLRVGQEARVVRIEGATAVVARIEQPQLTKPRVAKVRVQQDPPTIEEQNRE